MAGIKQIVAPPETFRFPSWKPGIFYAMDSVVVYTSTDSDISKIYVAIRDIEPNDPPPLVNFFWKEMATDASAFSAIVSKQLNNDSDFLALKQFVNTFDSEVKRQKNFDSDEFVLLRREIHDRRKGDSDIKVTIERLKLQVDSDNIVRVVDYDSDRARLRHDLRAADSDIRRQNSTGLDSEIRARRAADSDIRVTIERLKLQVDSDNIVKVSDYDSDRARLHHNFLASDSDLNVRVDDADSDISRLREWVDTLIFENDSDHLIRSLEHDSDVAMLYHDFRSADSDINASSTSDLDSEIHARRSADSDLNVRVDDADSEIERLKGWVSALIFENDSDNLVQNVDHDSDVEMLYHDFRAADSDIATENAKESHDRAAADSDLSVRVDDADSDILRLQGWVSTLLSENDSDNVVMNNEHDSDLEMTYHDFVAADSDIESKFNKDIHDLNAHDSDFAVNYDSDSAKETHDRTASDSDINISAIKEEHDRASADSDLQVQIDDIVNGNSSSNAFDYGTYF